MRQLIEIVPKYVNEAKPGKKYGSVKLADDTKYLVPAKMVSQLSANTPAKVETHTEKWSDGDVEIINKIVGGNGAVAAKQNVRARMDPADARGAYVTSMMTAFARAGKLSVNRDALRIARQEITAEYDGANSPQWASDMKDEVPENNWAVNSENPAD